MELQDYETLQEFAKAAKAKLDQNAWDYLFGAGLHGDYVPTKPPGA